MHSIEDHMPKCPCPSILSFSSFNNPQINLIIIFFPSDMSRKHLSDMGQHTLLCAFFKLFIYKVDIFSFNLNLLVGHT